MSAGAQVAHAREGPEQPVQVAFRDADPLVADAHDRPLVVAADLEVHGPARGEYFTAFETRLSSTSARRSRSAQQGTGSSGISATSGCMAPRGHAPHHLAGHRGQVHHPEVERELAGLEAVRLQGLLDQVRHVRGGVDDRARLLQAVRARSVRPPFQELGVAEHARQGRAEVVGHDVHELALHAVQLDELRVGALEGLVELGVAHHDADPVRQRLQGDDLARGEPARGVPLDVEDGDHLVAPQDGDGHLAARRGDEARRSRRRRPRRRRSGSSSPVAAPHDALVHRESAR
jgi:hypothetical protein